MIKVSASERRVIEKELIVSIESINDYLDGKTVRFESVLIHLEDVLDFFLSSGRAEIMRSDTRILFGK